MSRLVYVVWWTLNNADTEEFRVFQSEENARQFRDKMKVLAAMETQGRVRVNGEEIEVDFREADKVEGPTASAIY